MADNVPFTVTGATYTAATDKVTYSGDANVDVQLIKLVGVAGAEGSKAVTEVMGTAGSPGTAVVTIQGVGSGTAVPVSVAAPVAVTDNSGSLTVDNAGTFAVQAAQSGTWTARLQDGAGTAITSSTRGSQQAVSVQIVDASGNQITTFGGSAGVVSGLHVVAAASTNATNVKASAGTLRGFSFYNNAAYPVYLKFHNTAGAPTAGSGVVRTFAIQAGMQRDVTIPGGGLSFATGIAITLVQDLADAGTTAVAASDAVGEIFYE